LLGALDFKQDFLKYYPDKISWVTHG